MGLFDSSTTQESSLEVPAWMRDLPGLLSGEYRDLIGQDFLSPEEQVAPWSDALTGGVNALIGRGATGGIDDIIQGVGTSAIGGMTEGQEALRQLLAGGPAQRQGIDLDRVGSYINNDVIDSAITAALRDPYRGLTEGALPGMDLAAAATGNTGSTRIGQGGVAEGILQRGYEDRAADVGAAIRGGAYNTALGIGADEASQQASLDAMFQNLTGQAGSNLMQSGVQGANLLNLANQIGFGDIDAMIRGGGMQTAYDQSLRDAEMRRFMFPYETLPMLTQGVGSMANTYGTHVTEQTSSPSPFSAMLAGASTVFGMPGFGGGGGGAGGGGGYDAAGYIPISTAGWDLGYT